MRAAILSVVLVACATEAAEDPPKPWRARWIRSAGDGASQYGYGVAVDREGNVYAIGEYGGTINFGTGELANEGTISGYVVKLDRAGKALWSRRIGGNADASAYAIAVTDRVFVGGWFKGTMEGHTSAGETDAYLLELDPKGATISLRTFGDPGSQAITSLAVDEDAIVIAGDFDGTVDFGGGPLTTAGQSDLFLAAFDRSGAHRFSKRFGAASLDRRPRVAMDKQSIYFSGSYRERIDLGGGVLAPAYDGAFLARFERSGAHGWSHALAGDGWCFPSSLAVDARGAVAVGARFTRTLSVGETKLTSESGEDGLLAVVERDGKTRFAARYGGFGQDAISGIAFDGDDLYFAGELQTAFGPMTSVGAADAFVARLRDGKIDWFERLGDDQEQRSTRVAIDPLGGVVVVGSFFGNIGPARSNGGFDLSGGDAFVASFGP
jgi:hypothetical protein